MSAYYAKLNARLDAIEAKQERIGAALIELARMIESRGLLFAPGRIKEILDE